jgi:predicted Zn-dependent protease
MARQSVPQQAATLYGATLAAIKQRDYAEAHRLWVRLGARTAGDVPAARLARLLGVELLLAQGDNEQALRLLGGSGESGASASRAELFLAARARVNMGTRAPGGSAPGADTGASLARLTQTLQTWVANHPRDAQAWQLLSDAYAAQNRTLSAIRAQAEVNVAQLDYPAALSRFKTAQDWARKNGAGTDHYEASIVDTRTRQVELLVREQALER